MEAIISTLDPACYHGRRLVRRNVHPKGHHIYPKSMGFNPVRFLDENGQLAPKLLSDTKEEGHTSYGYGQRVCVGKHLANDSL